MTPNGERPPTPFAWSGSTAGLIRVVTLGLAGALAITGLSLGVGGWHLGELCAGLVVLWATTRRAGTVPVVHVVGYALGGVLVVSSLALRWSSGVAPILTVIAIVGGCFGAVDAGRRWRALAGVPLVPVWALASLGAIYACVPETDHIRWLALAVGAVILGEFMLGEPVDAGVTSVVVGLLGWAVLYGGHFRDSAMIAGVSCLGLLVAEPLGAWAVRLARGDSPREPTLPRMIAGAVLIALQVVGCLVMARNAGLRRAGSTAVVVVVPVLLMMTVVAGVLGALSDPDAEPSTDDGRRSGR